MDRAWATLVLSDEASLGPEEEVDENDHLHDDIDLM
jgi:hypothetical protein